MFIFCLWYPLALLPFLTLPPHRTLLQRIGRLMDQPLCPSSLGVTRLQSRLPQGTLSTILSISLLETFSIAFGVRTATVLYWWGFLLFQNVSQYVDVLSQLLICIVATKEHANDVDFRNFRRQMFHCSLAKILESLKPNMTTPDIVCCPDGHYRRVIYGLGPYIADYPEQVILSGVVQGWCPKYVAFKFNFIVLLRL